MAANASTTETTPTGCAPHSRAERRPSVCDAASPTQCALRLGCTPQQSRPCSARGLFAARRAPPAACGLSKHL
eukprot:6440203-Prymnesium_polylepis.1